MHSWAPGWAQEKVASDPQSQRASRVPDGFGGCVLEFVRANNYCLARCRGRRAAVQWWLFRSATT